MVTKAELLERGIVVRQDYDGLAGDGKLYCDPEKVLMIVNSDGVEELPKDENGNPVEIYPGRSKTVQSDADSTDINKIVARFARDGILPIGQSREGLFIDVTRVPDFRGALEQVRHASEYFQTLPAESRAIFRNDPAEFMDAIKDNSRLEDLIKAGVVSEDEVVNVPEAQARNADGTFASTPPVVP